MITTAEDLKAARQRLGLSLQQLADRLRVRRDYLRDLEFGRRPLSGPVTVAVEALLAGFQPEGHP